jgi:hypothetical protein
VRDGWGEDRAAGSGRGTPARRPKRPLRTTELLESVAGLYRRHWRSLVAVTALVELPAYAALVALSTSLAAAAPTLRTSASSPEQVVAIGAQVVAVLLIAHGASLLTGVLAVATMREHDAREGGATERGAAGSGARRSLRHLPALGAAFVITIAVLLALLVGLALALALALGPAAATAPAVAGPTAYVALLAGVGVAAAALFLITRWSLLAPAVVIEELGPVAALRRSWRLVSGSTWRLVALGLLVNVVLGILASTASQLGGGVAGIFAGEGAIAIVGAVVGGAVQVLLGPILPLTYLLLWDDLIARRR